MAGDHVAWIVEFDLVEVEFVSGEMHDHAGDTDVLRQAEFRQVAPQEIRAARDVIQGELCAVDEIRVALPVADVAGIVEQRGDDRKLCAMRTEPVRLLDAALVAGDEAHQCQRHIERVLHVVVGRIADEVARIAAGEQALEVVECEPQLVEWRAREGLGEKLPYGITYVGRIAYLNRVRHVVIVAPVLRHDTFLLVVGRIARRHCASGVSHAVVLTATEFYSPAGA